MSILPKNILCNASTAADGNMSYLVGDISQSLNNRKQFLLKNGIKFSNSVWMRCNHKEQITPIDWSIRPQYFGAQTQEEMLVSEVLVTQEKNLALTLLTADCLPVSFYDPATETIALAHISRHTLKLNLPQKTVGFLHQNFQVNPDNVLVQIGPHIKKESYTFPLPLQEVSPVMSPFIEEKNGYAYIDIVSANTHQLKTAGINKENISISEIDTATSPDYFSHHRSTRNKTTDSRFATTLSMC